MGGLAAEINYDCYEVREYDDEGNGGRTVEGQLRKITTIPGARGVTPKIEVVATFKDLTEFALFKQFMQKAQEYLTRGVIHSYDDR